MPIQFQEFKLPDGGCSFSRYLDSTNSALNMHGRLILTPHSLNDLRNRVTSYSRPAGLSYAPKRSTYSDLTDEVGISWTSLSNQALAKFRGKVRGGAKASLAVTAFSWRQSSQMIVKRLTQARNVLRRTELEILRDRKEVNASRRRLRKRIRDRNRRFDQQESTTANTILEGEFGWKSLFDDCQAAMKVLASDIPDTYITARATGYIDRTIVTGGGVLQGDPLRTTYYTGPQRTTICAKTTVVNHNLWLLNKLGLINLPAAMWDAIPWSFLVGMFVNVNAWLENLTDFVGLDFSEISQTNTTHLKVEHRILSPGEPSGYSFLDAKRKTRSIGTLPRTKLEVRLPNADLNLCVIASALLVQQATRLTKLVFR